MFIITQQPFSKLNRRFYGPYTILAKIGPMAYKLELPPRGSNAYGVPHIIAETIP